MCMAWGSCITHSAGAKLSAPHPPAATCASAAVLQTTGLPLGQAGGTVMQAGGGPPLQTKTISTLPASGAQASSEHTRHQPAGQRSGGRSRLGGCRWDATAALNSTLCTAQHCSAQHGCTGCLWAWSPPASLHRAAQRSTAHPAHPAAHLRMSVGVMTACTRGSSSRSTTYTRWMRSSTICACTGASEARVGWSQSRCWLLNRHAVDAVLHYLHAVQQAQALQSGWRTVQHNSTLQQPLPTFCSIWLSSVSALQVNSWMSPLVGPPLRLALAKKGCLCRRGGNMRPGSVRSATRPLRLVLGTAHQITLRAG